MGSRGGRPTEEQAPVTAAARLRLTADENAALAALAVRCGTTRARLLRRAVREMVGVGPDLFEDGLVDLREAARELAAAGRNLNQVAAKLNSGEYVYPSDILGTVREVAVTTARVQAHYGWLVRGAQRRWMSVTTNDAN